MHLKAVDLGLGSICIYSFIRTLNREEGYGKYFQALHLPEGLKPAIAVAVGIRPWFSGSGGLWQGFPPSVLMGKNKGVLLWSLIQFYRLESRLVPIPARPFPKRKSMR